MQAIAANDAMDVVVRKAVELGVAAIQPVITARSARFPAGERGDKRLAHWRQIAVAACEQCGRNRIPPVDDRCGSTQWLAALRRGRDRARPRRGRHRSLPAAPALDVLIGPEGGFDAGRGRAGDARGFTPVRIGPRVLRTETAALAALAAMNPCGATSDEARARCGAVALCRLLRRRRRRRGLPNTAMCVLGPDGVTVARAITAQRAVSDRSTSTASRAR